MALGQKIVQLRTSKNISQEQLAEALDVSRQTVSKWEMEQALPKIDKIIQLAGIFGVTTDALLRDEMDLSGTLCAPKRNKYFGTDGFRGEANVSLTSMQAYKVGRFLGWYYGDTEWDFENNAVTEDITLVAKWKLVGNYTKPFLPKN